MPRRRRHGVAGLLLTAAAAAGCQADLGTAGCQIYKQETLPGSPLMLLPDARLDVIGSRYALIGHDTGTNAIRWATLTSDGAVESEHAYGLPAAVQNPLFAMAAAPATASQPPGTGDAILTGPSPGDTVLIGYIGTDATSGQSELVMLAVPADGSAPAGPPASILEFPGGPPSSMAMVSSRKGVHAALAWVDDQMGRVMYAALDGTGAMVVSPTPVGSALPGFSYLEFTPGKDDATIVYYSDNATNANKPGWILAEANESGGIDSSLALLVSVQPTTPAAVTPTPDGYALAWQDPGGGRLDVYTAANPTLPDLYAFAPSTDFGGAALQPPLVALATFGSDFGVLFQRLRDEELWRLDGMGDRRSGALVFPSALGNLGGVSTVRVTPPNTLPADTYAKTWLVATYADYTGADAASGPAGDRLLVTATCY